MGKLFIILTVSSVFVAGCKSATVTNMQVNANGEKSVNTGLQYAQETSLSDSTNDRDLDFDRDGLSNGEEIALGTNIDLADSDNDGASDKEEVVRGTSPLPESLTKRLQEKRQRIFQSAEFSFVYSEKYKIDFPDMGGAPNESLRVRSVLLNHTGYDTRKVRIKVSGNATTLSPAVQGNAWVKETVGGKERFRGRNEGFYAFFNGTYVVYVNHDAFGSSVDGFNQDVETILESLTLK